jgi:hypothetical protein
MKEDLGRGMAKRRMETVERGPFVCPLDRGINFLFSEKMRCCF